jgi:predicted glycosyltransferase
VLVYSHDGTGLGHLRITLGIAEALAGRRPGDAVLLLTGSGQIPAFDLPANLDWVKLPAWPKRELYEALPHPASPPAPFKQVVFAREAVARAVVQAFAPDLLVVDHAPAGLFRELAPAIDWLRAARPEARLALLMRDITFGPEQTRTIWTNEGVYPLLDGVYDRILVYGQQEVFDPIAEYGMSPAAAARTRFCGYLPPPQPRRAPAQVRAELGVGDRPLVAVSVGGGADGGPVLRAFLDGWPRFAPPDLAAYVVAGPLLPAAERAAVEALAAGLDGVRLVPFDPDYLAVARAADAVVGMGGYNSLCEAAFIGKRAVVVPRRPGPEEQIIRARRFAALGLATVVEPDALSPEGLWPAVLAALADPTSPPPVLSFAGARAIVDALDVLLAAAAAASHPAADAD